MAYTYLYEPYSYYQKSRCTRLSVVMHEMGHSLGFRHSGLHGNGYADESGYMGYANNVVGWPQKAFNGHKHWISGWFTDRSIEVYPLKYAAAGRLAAFVDYGKQDLEDDDVVLVRVGNLYVHFNRAKSYNVDSNGNQDQVTLTESEGEGELSNSLGGLSSGESYSYKNFVGSAYDLIIQVCDIVELSFDYALLSIHLNDGKQVSICNSPNSFGRDFASMAPPQAASKDMFVQNVVEATSLPVAVGTLDKKPKVQERPGSKLQAK